MTRQVEPEDFEILSTIRNIQVIAAGRGVRIQRQLRRNYGGALEKNEGHRPHS